jgi:hypothetical protein
VVGGEPEHELPELVVRQPLDGAAGLGQRIGYRRLIVLARTGNVLM